MTGADALRLARYALVVVLAERRLAGVKRTLKLTALTDERIAELRRQHKSAALSIAGYRRGLESLAAAVIGAGVGVPKLKPLEWEPKP